jgi:hypothetical protein
MLELGKEGRYDIGKNVVKIKICYKKKKYINLIPIERGISKKEKFVWLSLNSLFVLLRFLL